MAIGDAKKAWDLNKGDQARHGTDGELLTFRKMDGRYAQWTNANGDIVIGHADEYILGDDGIYIG